MVYIFEIIDKDCESFTRVVKIKSEQTFLELHKLIQKSVGYDNKQLASFYTVDTLGMRNLEISLFEMSDEDDELEVLVMDVTMIREIVDGKHHKLIYVYDFFGDRYFDLSLVGTEKEESLTYPMCTLSEGDAPKQISEDEDLFINEVPSTAKKKEVDPYADILEEYKDDAGDSDVTFESLDDYNDIL